MAKRLQQRVSPLRVTSMMVLLLGGCALLTHLARNVPDSLGGNLSAAVLGLVVLLIAASLLEWLVHRYVYHRRWLPFLRRIYAIHHQGHHRAIFPTWRYVTNGPVRRHPILATGVSSLHTSAWRNALVKLSHFFFYMAIGAVCLWLPAWLLTGRAAFLAGMVAASAVVSDLFVRVHDAIHYPGTYRLIEAQCWFPFLENHHYIHHVDTEANVNFLLPLADWLFGTMRRGLSLEEVARHAPWRRRRPARWGRRSRLRTSLDRGWQARRDKRRRFAPLALDIGRPEPLHKGLTSRAAQGTGTEGRSCYSGFPMLLRDYSVRYGAR